MRPHILPYVNFFHDYHSLPFPRKKLTHTAMKLYHNELKKNKDQYLNVILYSDYKMKKLNYQYRQRNRPTDVLSFCFNDPDFLGEIYISLQRADIQARRYGVSYSDEVTRLFIHGFFHLLGYDHHTENDREVMEAYEQKYR